MLHDDMMQGFDEREPIRMLFSIDAIVLLPTAISESKCPC
jgi:hypothetical protein